MVWSACSFNIVCTTSEIQWMRTPFKALRLPGASNYFDIREMCFLYFNRFTRFVNEICAVNRRNQADRSRLFFRYHTTGSVGIWDVHEVCIAYIIVVIMSLSPGYDFKLQPVVRHQIRKYRVAGNVEQPLNYQYCSVHSYPVVAPVRVKSMGK